MTSKRAVWSRLTDWLIARNEPIVTITWSKLDEIVCGLPDSATTHSSQWWYGDRPNTRAWRKAGYVLVRADKKSQTVTLKKSTEAENPTQVDRTRQRPSGPKNQKNDQSKRSNITTLQTIDPHSTLIVLPCSGGKRTGGTPQPANRTSLWPPELLLARDRIRDVANVEDRQLMPAWQRYNGYFYKEAEFCLKDAVSSGANIAILSGAYGVVHAEEPIGWYDKELKKNKKDWPDSVIQKALISEAARVNAREVVTFAANSTDYAKFIRSASWKSAGIRRAVLVTVGRIYGNPRQEVPQALGAAFCAFWSGSDDYPINIQIEELM